jgi:hypothetical protein
MRDRVFVARTEPEVALVQWRIRMNPAQHYVCDQCNGNLDWEPFPVIILPTKEELKDPYYVPEGGDAFCRTCARKCYHLTKKDVCKARWIWLCHEGYDQCPGG